MPIYVTFYHLDQTMVGKTEGEITLADLMGYLDDVEKARAVGYAKIFDCLSGQSNLLPDERDVFAKRLAAYHARYGKQAGPFAVVAGPDVVHRLADLQALVPPANTRPVRIFGDIHSARAWIAEQS
ncbi:MAG: hypothetical protein JSR47_14845 [Proteobacteria bacterium]|nr:hypothetical protein [Pseudomonadota bacterium]